jgi:hypothetical protein
MKRTLVGLYSSVYGSTPGVYGSPYYGGNGYSSYGYGGYPSGSNGIKLLRLPSKDEDVLQHGILKWEVSLYR